jgi:hypothetical protein
MMMKKYLAAAVFAGSLLAAPAFAQTATSCDAMLKDFDNHLTSNNIQPTDARVTQARTQAEQACMSGDQTTAEATLDRAVADLGIPPRTGKSTGGNTGGTESGSTSSQGTGSTNGNASGASGTNQSGTQNSTNSGSTNGGTQGSNSGQSNGSSSSSSSTQ